MTSGATDGQLPNGLELARTTDVFDNDTVPAGLLRAHRVANGTWGRLVGRVGLSGVACQRAATPARRAASPSALTQ